MSSQENPNRLATTGRAQLRVVDTTPVAEIPQVDIPQFNLRIALPCLYYVRDTLGEPVMKQVLERCGLPEKIVARSAPWVSHERLELLLREVRDLTASDAEFMRACAYDLRRLYGPITLVLRCMTVQTAYWAMARTSHLVSKVSRFEVIESTRTSVRLKYTSEVSESRLCCLSRQAALRTGPTLWLGYSAAVLEERACMAQGDDACIYDIRWQEPIRWRRALAGAALGALAAFGLPLGFAPSFAAAILLGTIGLAAGVLLEQRRLLADYVQFHDESTKEYERVVEAHGRAVDEVLALHERERQWSTRLESDMASRKSRIEQVVGQIDGSAKSAKLRSLSHDIGNPLTVLSAAAMSLQDSSTIASSEDRESIEAMSTAVHQLSALVTELGDVIRDEASSVDQVAEVIDVAHLSFRIRRQLRATVTGRDVRVTVFSSREVPERVTTFPLILSRIVDNLLTNASKYTERGSIVVDVGGAPGFLVLKISDTGRGIGKERLERVFAGNEPDPTPPAIGTSHGDGMTIVVRLLAQIGGRLEIMSEPAVGTTLWVYIPSEPSHTLPAPIDDDPIERIVERVVTIRSRPS